MEVKANCDACGKFKIIRYNCNFGYDAVYCSKLCRNTIFRSHSEICCKNTGSFEFCLHCEKRVNLKDFCKKCELGYVCENCKNGEHQTQCGHFGLSTKEVNKLLSCFRDIVVDGKTLTEKLLEVCVDSVVCQLEFNSVNGIVDYSSAKLYPATHNSSKYSKYALLDSFLELSLETALTPITIVVRDSVSGDAVFEDKSTVL